jgi:hypothetical protein
MKVSVLTRTDSEHRIIEDVFLDKTEACDARHALLKQYGGRYDLCRDTEVDTFDVKVFVATKVKAYGCSGEDPEVTILCVGTKAQCVKAAEAEIESLTGFINGDSDGDAESGWTGVDADEDTVYVVEVHEA